MIAGGALRLSTHKKFIRLNPNKKFDKAASRRLEYSAKRFKLNSKTGAVTAMEQGIKVKGEIKLMAVSQRQMAAALELSTTRINQLIDEGLLIRDESTANGRLLLFESLKTYFLSKNTGNEELSYTVERAKLTKAKRELAELKLAKAKGNLYEAQVVEDAFTTMLTILRKNLLTIPAKYSRQLEMKSAEEIYDALNEEITACLTELSEFDTKTLAAEVDWDAEDA